MKVHRIPFELRADLKRAPEYYMGVQKALVTFPGNVMKIVWIFNGRFFLTDADKTEAGADITGYRLFHESLAGAEAKEKLSYAIDLSDRIDIRSVESRSKESLAGVKRVAMGSALLESKSHGLAVNERMTKAESGAAKDAPITQTEANEIFKRFSAFKDDYRVTAGRGLTPGTFATTAEDAVLHVRTGTDAVRRYALPNKTPANQVFTIMPPGKSTMQRGIAQPAYGEPGGGVEVIFVDGSPDGTVYGPKEIPAT